MGIGGRDTLGLIIFSLFTALVLQVSAEACDTVGWNSEDRQCPEGQIEIYKDVRTRSGTTNRMCCKPATVKARQEKIRAEGCYATNCLSSTSDKPCVDTTERYVDGKLVEYEEAMRGTCSRGKGSDPGFLAVCCAKNSTEGLLISTLGAEANEFPHQVKLKLPGQCGGTIYNSRWIITAAHCVVHNGTRDPVSKMKVVIGTNIASMYTEDYVYRVKSAIPRFNYSKLEWPNNTELEATMPRSFNDIALLELDRDIVFTDKIKALEIAPENFDPFEYSDKAVIVGWGTSDTASTTIHLQKANFILRSDYKCFDKKIGKRKGYSGFEDSLLCVGGILDGKWSNIAGKGDSGGPAICRNKDGNPVLCGVASFSVDTEMCATIGSEWACAPTVYTEVAYFRKWIQEHAGPQDPSSLYKPVLYGEKAPPGKYAHQVHITSETGKSCGGTLIAKDVVVTAAHCVYQADDTKKMHSGLKVTTGINDLVNGKGQTFGVKAGKALKGFKREGDPVNITAQGNRVRMAEDYHSNDLAVIKLDGEASVSQDELPAVPAPGKSFHEGTEISFPKDTSKTGQLTSREFSILDLSECQRRMKRLSKANLTVRVQSSTLCGVEKYSGGSTCDRELGGGLICKGKDGKDVLCGVQVFRLCEFSIPNGFVNVGRYSSWVKEGITKL